MEKALFLDIDGVLQPCGQQERFSHLKEIPAICAELNKTIDIDFDYEAFAAHSYSNTCDIGAVYFDWDKPSVERLRRILDTTGARIVLSTNWRERGMKCMKGLMAIHGLDKYVDDATYCIVDVKRESEEDWRRESEMREAWRKIQGMLMEGMREIYPSDPDKWFGNSVSYRMVEIREYLDRHPEITSYVALDDQNLEKGAEGHSIQTPNYLREEDGVRSIELLNLNDGPFLLADSLHTPELQAWREKYVKPYADS